MIPGVIRHNPCLLFSAKTGENVEDAFLETARKIFQNIQVNDDKQNHPFFRLNH